MFVRAVSRVGLLIALLFASARIVAAEPPAGLSVSPTRVSLTSPEFRNVVSVRNDGDRALTVKLVIEAWTQDDAGRPVLTPNTDVTVTPATVSVPAKDSVQVFVEVKTRPRGVEAAYRLFVDEDGAPVKADRFSVPVFVHYGRPVGVPFVESLAVSNGEIDLVVRNLGGGYLSVPNVRVRGVGANGRDVFERTVEASDLLAQRRLVLRIPLEGEQCGQSRQIIVTVVTSAGAPMSILNLQPTSCPSTKSSTAGR